MAGRAPYILTTTSIIKCTHGGALVLQTTNTQLKIDGAPALLETDIHPVVGCPFTVGPRPSPCVRVEWEAGAVQTKVNGVKVLVDTSIGRCIGADGATQGIAIILSTQMKVHGT